MSKIRNFTCMKYRIYKSLNWIKLHKLDHNVQLFWDTLACKTFSLPPVDVLFQFISTHLTSLPHYSGALFLKVCSCKQPLLLLQTYSIAVYQTSETVCKSYQDRHIIKLPSHRKRTRIEDLQYGSQTSWYQWQRFKTFTLISVILWIFVCMCCMCVGAPWKVPTTAEI